LIPVAISVVGFSYPSPPGFAPVPPTRESGKPCKATSRRPRRAPVGASGRILADRYLGPSTDDLVEVLDRFLELPPSSTRSLAGLSRPNFLRTVRPGGSLRHSSHGYRMKAYCDAFFGPTPSPCETRRSCRVHGPPCRRLQTRGRPRAARMFAPPWARMSRVFATPPARGCPPCSPVAQ